VVDKVEEKEKTGRMWTEPEAKVLRKGSWTVGGKKHYGIILETFINGERKYELMKSCGLLYPQEEKEQPTSPDIKGPVTIDGVKYKFAGWKQESESGVPYTNIKLRPVGEETEF
jgi:hypothetical protein